MITPAQREARRHSIGSSDIPALLGLSPWKNAHDVWAEKCLELEPDGKEDDEAILIGNLFEAPLVEWAGKKLGREVRRDLTVVHPKFSFLTANLDGLAKGPLVLSGESVRTFEADEIIEAKTGDTSEYGEIGTDEVPARVIAQVHHQFNVAGLSRAWVPVPMSARGRMKPELFRVDLDPDMAEIVLETAVHFWEHHVLTRTPPENILPSLDTIKRVKRGPAKRVKIDPVLIEIYEAAAERYKAAEEERDLAQVAVLAAIGDAEEIDFLDPKKIYAYRSQSRAGIDAKRFRQDYPQLAKQYETISIYRTLRKINR
jgi:putative phage-type endonuclease